MRTSILIINAEKKVYEHLKKLTSTLLPETALVEHAPTFEEADFLLHNQSYTLIISVVEIAGKNVFDFLSQKISVSSKIIIIATHTSCCLKAIELSGLPYLTSPVKKSDLKKVITEVFTPTSEPTPNSSVRSEITKIALPSVTGLDFVNISNIVRCEADNNYSILHFYHGNKKIVSRTLSQFEKELLSYNFMRVHRKHLVNLKLVESYYKGKGGGHVVLYNHDVIPVSARKKNELMSVFAF